MPNMLVNHQKPLMKQDARDDGYSKEHVFELANSTNSIHQRFLFITDSSDTPKNQFQKL